jgi:hypothetical protein
LDTFIYENCDEYLISNALLVHVLRPKKVIDKIIGGVEFVERIFDWDLHATMRKVHDIAKNSRSVIANRSSLTSNFISSAREKQIEVSFFIVFPTACL